MYLLVGSKEGADWKDATIFSIGSLEKIEEVFAVREKPFILWYLIDLDKLSDEYSYFRHLESIFLDVQRAHPDLLENNYHYDPFVGFFDSVATTRGWGILKKMVDNEVPHEISS